MNRETNGIKCEAYIPPPPPPVQTSNEIWYTSNNGNIVTPYDEGAFGVNIISNTYENGKGIITFDEAVTSIGNKAFYNCNSLTSINITDSVTSIGNYAFQGCNSLTSITIPDSVTSIGHYAFYDCTSLTSVYCKPTTPPTGGYSMFFNNASDRNIYVPTASVIAYKSTQNWLVYAGYIVGYDFEDDGEEGDNQFVITFLVGDNETYTFDEGMTWREWIYSEHNTGGYYIFMSPEGEFVNHHSGETLYIKHSGGEEYVSADDCIIKNATYTIG